MNIFKTYARWFLLLGWLVVIQVADIYGQSHTNPFEIRPRLEKKVSDNPFDVQKREKIEQMEDEDVLPMEAQNQAEVVDEVNVIMSNPFDVNHVPIRKSGIAKRTDKLLHEKGAEGSSNNFLFWLLLLASAIFALVINIKSKLMGHVFRSLTNENVLKLFQREENNGNSVPLYLLYVVFIINLAVFLYLISTYYGGQKGLLVFFIILGGTTLIYLLKHLGLFLVGDIFQVSKNTGLYSFTVMIFNLFIGVFLIPFNFILAFGSSNLTSLMIWFTAIALLLFVLLRTFRGFLIASEYFSDRMFQIIVYLCAFEIAPVLILIRIIGNFSMPGVTS